MSPNSVPSAADFSHSNSPTFAYLDNFYLDMNGIIHVCAKSDRVSNDLEIYTAIFAYIQLLVQTIRPKKLLFLAIDGVAPRAKMNQQRARRFRAAKEAKLEALKAQRKMEQSGNQSALSSLHAFDGNSITPGTEFLENLAVHLAKSIADQVATNPNWQGIDVIFSGPAVPGEGEHKIMEYIRCAKSQPAYDPNQRHCIYGLDADLIFLGLLTHEPHFALLREEVRFDSRMSKKFQSNDSNIRFYLMHLGLLREYIDLEFKACFHEKRAGQIWPDYSLEKVLDDFILMAVFVGNDFLPHLPNIHINDNALGMLLDSYKSNLPTLGGYLNEEGVVKYGRVGKVLAGLIPTEYDAFARAWGDRIDGCNPDPVNTKNDCLSIEQSNLYRMINSDLLSNPNQDYWIQPSNLTLTGKDRKFLWKLATDFNLEYVLTEDFRIELQKSREGPKDNSTISSCSLEDDATDVQSFTYVPNPSMLEKYESRLQQNSQPVVADLTALSSSTEKRTGKREKAQLWKDWKCHYYREKMLKNACDNVDGSLDSYDQELPDLKGLTIDNMTTKNSSGGSLLSSTTGEEKENIDRLMQQACINWAIGLQWNMFYYYRGVVSWSWFYPHHYSPHLSDLVNLMCNGEENDGKGYICPPFTLSAPLKPLEQLLAVLPPASSSLVPTGLAKLMTEPTSPLIHYYPETFKLDMNGKKAEWEAVVLISFINADLLIDCANKVTLTAKEAARNSFGPTWLYRYDKTLLHPDGSISPVVYNLPVLETDITFKSELCSGVRNPLPGFPSLTTVKLDTQLENIGISVFGSPASKEPSLALKVANPVPVFKDKSVEVLAQELCEKQVFVEWPFIIEAKVDYLTDSIFIYKRSDRQTQPNPSAIKSISGRLDTELRCNKGIELTDGIEILVWACPMIGLCATADGRLVKKYSQTPNAYPLQLVLPFDHALEDPRTLERSHSPLISEAFPIESPCIYLGPYGYGSIGTIVAHGGSNISTLAKQADTKSQQSTNNTATVKLAIRPSEPLFTYKLVQEMIQKDSPLFLSAKKVSESLGISPLLLSMITARLCLFFKGNLIPGDTANIGLGLKFESKGLRAEGYTKRVDRNWMYSQKALQLIKMYRLAFSGLFDRLKGATGQPGNVNAESIFPNITSLDELKEKLKPIKEWIAQHVNNVTLVSVDQETIPTNLLTTLDDSWKQYSLSQMNMFAFDTQLIENIPTKLLISSVEKGCGELRIENELRQQRFELGHRAIYVGSSGIGSSGVLVTFGATGTIVGITMQSNSQEQSRQKGTLSLAQSYQILLDEAMFKQDKPPVSLANRIATVKACQLLNLNNIQLMSSINVISQQFQATASGQNLMSLSKQLAKQTSLPSLHDGIRADKLPSTSKPAVVYKSIGQASFANNQGAGPIKSNAAILATPAFTANSLKGKSDGMQSSAKVLPSQVPSASPIVLPKDAPKQLQMLFDSAIASSAFSSTSNTLNGRNSALTSSIDGGNVQCVAGAASKLPDALPNSLVPPVPKVYRYYSSSAKQRLLRPDLSWNKDM